MTEVTVQSDTEEALGVEFWTQPEHALDEVHQFIYAQALSALRGEVRERDGGILDYMIVERFAFSYAILRMREAGVTAGGDEAQPLTDRTRREMNKDWLEFTLALKKIWNSEDKVDQSELVLKRVNAAVNSALKDMPETQARIVQNALVESFAAHGV